MSCQVYDVPRRQGWDSALWDKANGEAGVQILPIFVMSGVEF